MYGPPGNKVFWGGIGGYEQRLIRDFDSQSGKHPAVFGYFITWNAKKSALHWLGFRLSDATAERSRVMLNVQPPPGLSPGEIARGEGDAFLVAMTRLLAENGQVTYMRLLSEMNNGVNPYSPYDLNGRSRGPANSARSFKAMWRRAAIILRGGDVARINRRLRRLGQPAARTGAGSLPTPKVSLVWVPLTFGNPEVEHNHPRHFWPGGAYVDWVGTTWYSPHPNAERDGPLLPLPEVAAQAVRVRRVGDLGRRVAGLRGQLLRVREGAPAGADGRSTTSRPTSSPSSGSPPTPAPARRCAGR